MIDDPAEIDLILITHFHIDHVAALPYFTEKTNFQGKILMTHATKAVTKLLLSDNIRLQTRGRPLYTEQVRIDPATTDKDTIELSIFVLTFDCVAQCSCLLFNCVPTLFYFSTPFPPLTYFLFLQNRSCRIAWTRST